MAAPNSRRVADLATKVAARARRALGPAAGDPPDMATPVPPRDPAPAPAAPALPPSAVALCEIVTNDNFDPVAYAAVNPDVVEANGDDPARLREHLDVFGLKERRIQLNRGALAQVEQSRRDKLARLPLGLPLFDTEVLGVPMRMALGPDPRLPVPFERLSAHDYDPEVVELVDSHPDRLFVDVGAGMRRTYRSNVVNTEIAALASTDVLCFGDEMPFDSETFDGAICLAVLEHVPDPWHAAAEVLRVVKPGGTVIVDWPFLQPVHGYPHHYFNATEHGARETFERLGAEVRSYVPPWLHPVFTLTWFLHEWITGLPEEERDAFGRLTVAEILARDGAAHLGSSWVEALPESRRPTISSGTRLVVTRR